MEQKVRVTQTRDDGTAIVLIVRESACSGDCHKCSGCGAAKETLLFEAKNPIGAMPGDIVRVESETGPVLKAAAVFYVMPLLLFFVGYFVGNVWGLGALAGCLSFVLGVVLVVLYDRRMQKKQKTIYTITGFLN